MHMENNLINGSISGQIALMNELEVLLLNGNRISGALPPELFNIMTLFWLEIGGNRLEVGRRLTWVSCSWSFRCNAALFRMLA